MCHPSAPLMAILFFDIDQIDIEEKCQGDMLGDCAAAVVLRRRDTALFVRDGQTVRLNTG